MEIKTKVPVLEIKDPKTEVQVNSPEHHIEEIKEEIRGCLSPMKPQKAEAFWDNS